MRAALPLALAAALAACGEPSPLADPGNAQQVARGAKLYAQHCAACHGEKLEGQPE